MRLNKLHIRNFRKIQDLTIDFPRGLSVIVGENNAGKTTIIDALRLMLFPSREFDCLRLNEDDFRSGEERQPIEISCTFCDLNDNDEVLFQECLVDEGEGRFNVKLNCRSEFNEKTRRPNIKMWGGETEGGFLPHNLYNRISTVYLQPLRDPESGLRPGKHSQVARLIDCLTDEKEYRDFEEIIKKSNDNIRQLESVKKAKEDINTQMEKIAGNELTQKTDLIFSDPKFHRIIAGLHPEIEGRPYTINGLGFNNLVFTATTLGTLKKSKHYSFRSILIEEPEAHLHPHLQVLLLQHLAKVTEKEDGNDVQVITSSHSPILVSQAPIDSIISVISTEEDVRAISLCSIDYDHKLKNKLQRFLDATRAELFFARRILMVEGISEVLLLPLLAQIAGGCLKQAAVTILNADGINFNAFLPLFGEEKINIPVAILTDGDDFDKTGNHSDTACNLKEKEAEIQNLRVETSQITFEHELARSSELFPFMIEAYKSLHPQKCESLEESIKSLKTSEEKADAFLKEFIRNKTSKGRFAQELAGLLDEKKNSLTNKIVPEYIKDAFSFLGVNIIKKETNEKPGEVKRENSISEPH